MVLKLVERFPAIIKIGAAVLAFTAAKMIINEPILGSTFAEQPALRWGLTALVIAGVLGAGWFKERRAAAKQQTA
jgi:predicted tellurium resistance membrane protein TerC